MYSGYAAMLPCEPATSSMDIALRAAGIYRRMEQQSFRVAEYTAPFVAQLMC
jgi:hypothetical protein